MKFGALFVAGGATRVLVCVKAREEALDRFALIKGARPPPISDFRHILSSRYLG